MGLFPHLSVLENVMSGGRRGPTAGSSRACWRCRAGSTPSAPCAPALAALERVGVAGVAGRVPSAIPYGTAKKVCVARALMSAPRLLLLDEPASGLDESELEEFAGLISGLRASMGVLLVEHDMDFVMPLVDRLVVLNFGQVIAAGAPSACARTPTSSPPTWGWRRTPERDRGGSR